MHNTAVVPEPAIYRTSRKTKAFTLVELIVVITILAILGTIGFLSIDGYSTKSRDAARMADLTQISKGLDVLVAGGGTLPLPDSNYFTLSASGTVTGYQGWAGSNVQREAGFGGKGLDPLDNKAYTYSVNASQNAYQLMALLEGTILTINLPGTTTAYAGTYDTRSTSLRGSTLGILVGSGANMNQPAQENTTLTGVDLSKTTTGSGYALLFSSGDTAMTSAGTYTGSLFGLTYARRADLIGNKALASLDASLVAYWDMDTTTLTGGYQSIRDYSANGNHLACQGTGATWTTADCGAGVGPSYTSTKNGRGLWFDGGNSRLMSYGNLTGVPLGNSSETFIALVKIGDFNKPSSNQSAYYANVGYFGNGAGGNPNLFVGKNGRITHAFNNCDSVQANGEGVDITTAKWVGWAYDKTTSKVKFYVNGKLQDTQTPGGGSPGCPSPNLQNGAMIFAWDSSSRWFNGLIDEARIYNRALSDAEMQTIASTMK